MPTIHSFYSFFLFLFAIATVIPAVDRGTWLHVGFRRVHGKIRSSVKRGHYSWAEFVTGDGIVLRMGEYSEGESKYAVPTMYCLGLVDSFFVFGPVSLLESAETPHTAVCTDVCSFVCTV